MQGQGTVANIQANTVVVFGTNQGVFVYNGAPGPGNPPIASMSSGTVDPYGNTVKPQLEVSNGTSYINLVAGATTIMNVGTGDAAEATPSQVTARVVPSGGTHYILTDVKAAAVSGEAAGAGAELQVFSPTADLVTPPGLNLIANDGAGNQGFFRVISLGAQVLVGDFFVGAGGNTGFRITQAHTGEADIFSPKQTAGDTPAEIALLSALQTGVFPLVHLVGTNLTVDGPTTLSSTLTAITTAGASVVSADTWHTLTLTGATGTVQYCYEPNGPNGNGLIRLNGEAVLTGATAANFVLATIPFTFPRVTDVITPNNLAGAALGQRVVRVDTNGHLVIIPTGANTNFVIFDNVEAPLA